MRDVFGLVVTALATAFSPSAQAGRGAPMPSELLESAQSLSPGLATGAPSHRVGIDLPPAPRNLVPDLSFVANHQVNDSIVGKGWTLSGFSRIDRQGPTKGAPELADAPGGGLDTDRYFLDGVELIADPYPWHPSCNLRLEADDNRCFSYEPDNTWVARRDGWTWVWGEVGGPQTVAGVCATESIDEPYLDPCDLMALGAAGADSTGWLISRIIDPNGNEIRFDYDIAGSDPDFQVRLDGLNLSDTLYGGSSSTLGHVGFTHVPAQVSYGAGTASGTPTSWLTLQYDELRPDPTVSGRSGLLRLSPSRLTGIEIWNNNTGWGATQVGSYELQYVDEVHPPCNATTGDTPAPRSGLSLLERILLHGASGGSLPGREVRCMEYNDDPTSFERPDDASGGGGVESTNLAAVPVSDDERGFRPQVVNFDGDSWPDLAYLWTDGCENYPNATTTPCSTQHEVFENLRTGGSGWDLTASPSQKAFLDNAVSATLVKHGGAWMIVDLDQDGRDDVVAVAAGGTNTAHSFNPSLPAPHAETATSWTTLDPHHLLMGEPVDLNGDGLLDLLFRPSSGGLCGPACVRSSYEWIPNKGAPPYWDKNDLTSLDTPMLVSGGTGAIEQVVADLEAECTSIDSAYEIMPTFSVQYVGTGPSLVNYISGVQPGIYYNNMVATASWTPEEYIASGARFVDVNADGITDIAYSIHACWDNTGGGSRPIAYDSLDNLSFTYSRIYLGDGQGGWHDAELSAGIPSPLGFQNRERDDLPSDWDSATWDSYWEESTGAPFGAIPYTPAAGWLVLDIDRSGRSAMVQSLAPDPANISTSPLHRLWATPNLGVRDGFGLMSDVFVNDANYAGEVYVYSAQPNVDAASCGGWDLLSVRGCEEAVELPWHAFEDFRAPYHFLLPADWDGDGFVDFLRLRLATDYPATSTEAASFEARMYANQRVSALGRLEVVHDQWKGRTTFAYEFIAEPPGEQHLPFTPEVLVGMERGSSGSASASTTTKFAYEGGSFRDGEFEGFRDVVVFSPTGRISHTRFGLEEPLRGKPAYTVERRSDLSVEVARVFSFYDHAGALDISGPRFNPLQRKCDWAFEPKPDPGVQSIDIQVLIDDCYGYAGGDPTAAGLWADAGWGGSPTMWTPNAVLSHAAARTDWEDPELLPPDVVEPGRPTFTFSYGTGTTSSVMYVTDWLYNSDQRKQEHRRHRQSGDPQDDLFTTYSWATWDPAAHGFPLTQSEDRNGAGLMLRRRVRSGFTAFDRPTQVTETGWISGAGSRSWTYTYNATGEVVGLQEPGVLAPGRTINRNVCGLPLTETDEVGRTRETKYDAACRPYFWSFEGAETTVTRDAFGRLVERVSDSGGPTISVATGLPKSTTSTTRFYYDDDLQQLDDRIAPSAESEPRIGMVEVDSMGDDLLTMVHLDPMGRDFLVHRCAGTASSAAGSVNDLTGAGGFSCSSNDTYVRKGWSADGQLRFVTRQYDDSELAAGKVPATWFYPDEFGRDRVTQLPSPADAVDSAGPDYVKYWTSWDVLQQTVTDPLGVDCVTAWGAVTESRTCGGISRGAVKWSPTGQVLEETDPTGVVRRYELDTFGRTSARYLDVPVPIFPSGGSDLREEFTWDPRGRLLNYRDSQANVYTWGYDNIGRPLSATFIDNVVGSTVPQVLAQWTYTDHTGSVSTPSVQRTDINGNAWHEQYDGWGRLHYATMPSADSTERGFDDRGRIAWERSVDGQLTTRTYDAYGRVIADGFEAAYGPKPPYERLYEYSGAGLLERVEDREGVVTTYAHAWSGAVIGVERQRTSHAAWSLGTWGHNTRGDLVDETKDGVRTMYTVDDLGRPIEAFVGTDGTYEQVYLEWGWTDRDEVAWTRRSTPGSAPLQTSFFYNDAGWVEEIQHPGTSIQTTSPDEFLFYDAGGNQVEHRDEEGLVSSWTFDGFGRQTSESLPGQDTRFIHYQHGVSPIGTAGPKWSATEVHVPHASGWTIWSSYADFAGRPVRQDNPDGTASLRFYDGGQLRETQWFDHVGTLTTRAIQCHDAFGRLEWRWGPVESALVGGSTPYTCGAKPSGPETIYSYAWDGEGRVTQVQAPDSSRAGWTRTLFKYEDGVLAKETVEGVRADVYAYDSNYPQLASINTYQHTGGGLGPLERTATNYWHSSNLWLDAVVVDDGTDEVAVTYDQWDAYGTPRDVRNAVGTAGTYPGTGLVEQTAYLMMTDDRGRVSDVRIDVEGATVADVAYSHFANGLVDAVDLDLWPGPTSPPGNQLYTLVFDRTANPDLVLEQVRELHTGVTVADLPLVQRDEMGRAEQILLGNGSGARLERSWDVMGRMDQLVATTQAGNQQTRNYLYDDRGRLEVLDIQQTGAPNTLLEYGYQEPGWLVEQRITVGAVPQGEEWYTLDAAGNRRFTDLYDGAGALLRSVEFQYSPGEQLTSRIDGGVTDTYSWDLSGGMTVDASRDLRFERGPRGKVQSLVEHSTSTTLLDFIRDPQGMPVRVREPGVGEHTTIWGNPGGSWPLATIDETGKRTVWVAAEGVLLGRIEENALVPTASDALGSLVMVDQALLGDHGAWGARTQPDPVNPTSFTFAGMEQLVATNGLQSAGHRMYDPETGRFLSMDPAGLAGGMHRYMYANNQPTAFVDPLGLMPGRWSAPMEPMGGPWAMGHPFDLSTTPYVPMVGPEADLCGPLGCGAVEQDTGDSELDKEEDAEDADYEDDPTDWVEECRDPSCLDGRDGESGGNTYVTESGEEWDLDAIGAEVSSNRENLEKFNRALGGDWSADRKVTREEGLAGMAEPESQQSRHSETGTDSRRSRAGENPFSMRDIGFGSAARTVMNQGPKENQRRLTPILLGQDEDAADAGGPNWSDDDRELARYNISGELINGAVVPSIQSGDRHDDDVAFELGMLAGGQFLRLASFARYGTATRWGIKSSQYGGDMVDLYRAVGPDELADIRRTGQFRNLGNAEGKYFTTSAKAASDYARQAVSAFGDEPYTIVHTQISRSRLADPSIFATVDGGIPAYVVPDGSLPTMIPSVLTSSPIP